MKNRLFVIILILYIITPESNTQWFVQESGTTELLYSIQFADNDNGWVVDLNGTKLFHTTNGGTEWFIQKDFITPTIWNFTFINDSVGYIYSHGEPAQLLKTVDGGTTWQTIHTFSLTVDDLKFYDENTAWCVENELTGVLSKTTNGGLTWQGINYFSSFDGIFGKVGIINENTIIVTSILPPDSNIIFKTTDGGITWAEIPVSEDLTGGRIQFINANIGWIGSLGKLYKTTDGGFNWELQVSSLSDFFFINQNEGWYVVSNQINKTTDGGETWIPQNSGTTNTLYTIYFFDQDNGWISGNNGIILYTPNRGLPVELLEFKAIVSGDDVNLNWQTATETNNQGFQVERKTSQHIPGKETLSNWEKIGYVGGYGTTTEIHNYKFMDDKLSAGKYSYRLKQIDFDGSFEYSNEAEVEIAPVKFFLAQNYPNPFNPTTVISWQSSASSRQTLKIYDVLGKEVATLVDEIKPAGSYEVEFNAGNLASGIYFYRLKTGSFMQTKKMSLLR